MPAPWHYLDHAASSPLRPEARAAMAAALDAGYGNPSGAHALARAGRVGARRRARASWRTSSAPHPARSCSRAAAPRPTTWRSAACSRPAAARRCAPPSSTRRCSSRSARAAGGSSRSTSAGWSTSTPSRPQLDDTVTLVSVGLVNNEVGTVQPLDDDRRRRAGARARGGAAHRRRPGAHLARPRRRPPGRRPHHPGLAQVRRPRRGRRAGGARRGDHRRRSRSAGGRSASGAAARRTSPARWPSPPPAAAAAEQRPTLVERARAWRDALVTAIAAAVAGTRESAVPRRIDPRPPRRRHRQRVPAGGDSEALLFVLEHDHRVLASAASSCASGAQEPSHVLAALGIDRALAAGSLRLSLGWSTTQADIDVAVEAVPAAAARLQAHARDGAPGMTERVLVAMSGGVDSSVAAALLLEAGHEVVGATLKLWGGESDSGCCSVADVDDARSVARRLGIEHHTFSFGDDFDEHVVAPYVADHAAGRTPNPCIECNRHLKFDRLAAPGRRARLRRRGHRPPRPDRRACRRHPARGARRRPPPRTSPTSSTCSTRRRSPASASRSATSPRPTCAPRPPGSASPPPTSPTARTCASSPPPAAAPRSSSPGSTTHPGTVVDRRGRAGRPASRAVELVDHRPAPRPRPPRRHRAALRGRRRRPARHRHRRRPRRPAHRPRSSSSAWTGSTVPSTGPLVGPDQRPRRTACRAASRATSSASTSPPAGWRPARASCSMPVTRSSPAASRALSRQR